MLVICITQSVVYWTLPVYGLDGILMNRIWIYQFRIGCLILLVFVA